MKQPLLRIALCVMSKSIPFWVYKMIEIINEGNYAEIVLIIENNSKKENVKAVNNFIYRTYEKVENKLFKSNPSAFKSMKINSLLDCESISVNSTSQNQSDYFGKETLSVIDNFHLDVIINLGQNKLSEDIVQLTKYGVWFFSGGDGKNIQSNVPGVSEILNKSFITGITLNMNLCNSKFEQEEFVVTSTNYATHKFNISKNRNQLYFKLKTLIPRQLNLLFQDGYEKYFKGLEERNSVPNFYSKPYYEIPTTYETFKGIVRNYAKLLKNIVKSKFYFDQYILLYNFNNSNNFSNSFYKFKRILPPKDRFWADPFIHEINGKYFVFFEELIYTENKGKISVLELSKDGQVSEPKVVLEKPYHLSYPLLFEENKKLYMLPETSENRTIELYECLDFPYKWKLSKVLMENINATDATPFKYGNLYWLFTNVGEEMGASTHDELYLFYTEDLFNGTWQSHPQNPIVTDVQFSRPAGNLFVKNHKIYRPAQDCSKRYGYAMHIREITILDKKNYEEREVQAIYPEWSKDVSATHTLNHHKELTIIDAIVTRKK
ncbi:hypothetical protein FF125_12115 [Aureibaculum algae]|uniref:Glucosamine inositolphosphorylceramide transferase 1 N-terminal domain-containing protein n=1 Tax=Aureibaculum algae TaxID=2584122 RepID=A0A5B7TQV0_9FLAO|nr:hypothetical protein [Aureibaculum algae]QCX39145.1 hypothetical protein FF125_12115 [Aureibaculum algae]